MEEQEASELERRYNALLKERDELLQTVKEQNRMLLLARDMEIGLRVTLLEATDGRVAYSPARPQALARRLARIPIAVIRRLASRLARFSSR